jgi:hypothetical protein
MQRIPLSQLLALSALMVGAACSDNVPAPSDPQAIHVQPLNNIFSPASQCSNDLAKTIAGEIKDLYRRNTDRTEASKQLQDLMSVCELSDPVQLHRAGVHAVNYVEFFLTRWRAGALNLGAPAWALHVNEILLLAFGRVYGPPNQGIAASSFGTYGTIGVCGPAGCLLTTPAGLFALRVNVGTLGAPDTEFEEYIFAIAPVSNGNCESENLDFHGPCHDATVNPYTTFPAPYITYASCTADAEGSFPAADFVHARPTRDPNDNASFVKIPPEATNPLVLQCPSLVPSDLGGFAFGMSRSQSLWAWARNSSRTVGARALAFLMPAPAYAWHVFPGSNDFDLGSAESGSNLPIGVVDPQIFLGNFTNDVVGQQPDPSAEKGTWTSFTTNPGSITVQASLGDMNDTAAVLSQGGGACVQCGGLQLTGTVAGTPPIHGKYSVSWRSLQSNPTLKEAPFVIRSSNNERIAVLSYKAQMQNSILTFTYSVNGVLTTTQVGTWDRDVSQLFEIIVDLDTKTVELRIDNVLVASGGFISALATDLKQVAAEFTGIDAGVIAWDDVQIKRLPDAIDQ